MIEPAARLGRRLRRAASRNGASPESSSPPAPDQASELVVDLERRRDQLVAKVAELQWDLGGLVYEMSVRNRIQIEVLVRRAVALQDADAELGEVERILRMEQTGMAGSCATCGAPHSNGATFCWQCGQPLLQQLSSDAILRR
ncbi:MAG TPA: hypothetical protein VGF04_09715 [Solirubrobacterales bacterium]|jgi:hypothetical protein